MHDLSIPRVVPEVGPTDPRARARANKALEDRESALLRWSLLGYFDIFNYGLSLSTSGAPLCFVNRRLPLPAVSALKSSQPQPRSGDWSAGS